MAKSTQTHRRRDIRRGLPDRSPRWMRYLVQPQILWSVLFVAMVASAASLISIEYRDRTPWQINDVLSEPVVSRVAFRMLDPDATRLQADQARAREVSVYLINRQLLETIERLAMTLYGLASDERGESFAALTDEERIRLRLQSQGFDAFRRPFAETAPEQWQIQVDDFLRQLQNLPIVADLPYEAEPRFRSTDHSIRVIDEQGNTIKLVRMRELMSISDTSGLARVQEEIAREAKGAFRDQEIADRMTNLVMSLSSPMLVLDPGRTAAARQAAFEQSMADSQVFIEIEAGDVLAKSGQRLDALAVSLLKMEAEVYRRELPGARLFLSHLTLGGMILIVVAGMWLYAARYSPRVIENPWRGFSLAGILLLTHLMAVTVVWMRPTELMVGGLFPTLLATLVLAIIYDQRFALAAGAMHAMLVTLSLGQSVGFLLVLLVGAAVAVQQVDDLRSRSKLVSIGFWTGLAVALTAGLVGLAERPLHLPDQMWLIGLDVVRAFGTALATGIVVQAMLPMLERVFHVTTAMTLKELQDASHPLLRQLADHAPGTYQHSLRISDLAEAAAKAIGANDLLCKVGALYHDIGKMNKPEYFVENQSAGINRHDRLSPAMSLLIIIGHVKDGIEMAREYGLPRPVRHFIESHHGTTLVEYFYNQARQKTADGERAAQPSDHDFRYPGPKPETREAAIMMLCDAVESASRTLSDPTPSRLETLVHSIAQKRLADGQFDRCNLTLSELNSIEQAVHRSLCAIYHGRIAYPGQREAAGRENPPDERSVSAVDDNRPNPAATGSAAS